MNNKFAILDLGSNSFNLMIIKRKGLYSEVVESYKITVQLAKYLDSNNILSEEGINKCCQALSILGEKIDSYKSDNVLVCATYTIRSTRNIDDLLKKINKVFKYKITILSGEKEAETIFKGVILSNKVHEKFITCDIGGGSTEIVFANAEKPIFLSSTNMGCVTFTDMYLYEDIINIDSFNKAVDKANKLLEPIVLKQKELGFCDIDYSFGSSGTIKASFINRYLLDEHHDYISPSSLNIFISKCLSYRTHQELIDNKYDISQRKVILGGLAILKAVFDSLNIKKMYYSNSALREGAIYFNNNIDSNFTDKVLCDFMTYLCSKYKVDLNYINTLNSISNKVLSQFKHRISYSIYKQHLELLDIVNKIFLFGKFISHNNYLKNSYNILKSINIFGLNHKYLEYITELLYLVSYGKISDNYRGNINDLVYLGCSFLISNTVVILSDDKYTNQLDFDILIDDSNIKIINNNKYLSYNDLLFKEVLKESQKSINILSDYNNILL